MTLETPEQLAERFKRQVCDTCWANRSERLTAAFRKQASDLLDEVERRLSMDYSEDCRALEAIRREVAGQ